MTFFFAFFCVQFAIGFGELHCNLQAMDWKLLRGILFVGVGMGAKVTRLPTRMPCKILRLVHKPQELLWLFYRGLGGNNSFELCQKTFVLCHKHFRITLHREKLCQKLAPKTYSDFQGEIGSHYPNNKRKGGTP